MLVVFPYHIDIINSLDLIPVSFGKYYMEILGAQLFLSDVSGLEKYATWRLKADFFA